MERLIFIQPNLAHYRIHFFELLSKKIQAKVIVYHSSYNAKQNNIYKWSISTGKVRSIFFGSIFWQPNVAKLDFNKQDIIVLSGNPRFLSTIYLFAKVKFQGARVIWWSHLWSATSVRWRQILRFIPMSLADGILLYTQREIELLSNDRAFFNRNVPIHALNNGIYLEKIYKYRENYDARKRPNHLIFIGRVTKKSCLFVLVRAMATTNLKDFILHVVGEGSFQQSAENLAKCLKINDRIIWHGALHDENDIAQIANKCIAFVYPGSVGLSLIHAMAYALPAFVHNKTKAHMPEIAAFTPTINGEVFEYMNSDSLATVVSKTCQNVDLLNRQSVASTSAIQQSFNTDDMACRFLSLINEIEERKKF